MLLMCMHHFDSMKNPIPTPCVCTSVRRVSRTLARAYDEALAASPLNVTQLAVMRAVERHGGESLSRIAEDLAMDRTSLYRGLGPLQRRGLLEVSEGPDARSRQARLTDEGASALDDAGPRWAAMQVAIVERFGTEAWRSLLADLGRLQRCIPSCN